MNYGTLLRFWSFSFGRVIRSGPDLNETSCAQVAGRYPRRYRSTYGIGRMDE